MIDIILIAHNVRSCHNVGSLLRTADGLGLQQVLLTGYTPYPNSPGDTRLPHLAAKINRQIAKTALGAETSQPWQVGDITTSLSELRAQSYLIAALEQTSTSLPLPSFQPPAKLVLIVGREVDGIEQEVLDMCNVALEIPMSGKKESFNVVQAAAMALYHCRFMPFSK